ncbi:MAG TPA: translation initiation factor IF-2 [Terriglobales bacterium]|nr:translation initiation factor IF-2 [Terriglobales bacterium]
MEKIRINDLARELEVKSRAILEVLPVVGVTEKKTHSSSISVDEAVRVRAHFRSEGEGRTGASSRSSRSQAEPEIRTKIDLSQISRPGDVLKALQKPSPAAASQPVVPPPVARPAEPSRIAAEAQAAQAPAVPSAPSPSAPPAPPSVRHEAPKHDTAKHDSSKHETSKHDTTTAPVRRPAVASEPLPPRFVKPGEPGPRPDYRVQAAPPPPAAPVAAAEAPAPPAASTTEVENHPTSASSATDADSTAGLAPGSPGAQNRMAAAPAGAPPVRRMIVPQTGPRPVYQAPIRPPAAPAAPQGSRPAPGRPVPGQPIFQRPRPTVPQRGPAPGGPAGRRPMHPTRQAPAGAPGSRPLGVGPGAAPVAPGRPARPGGPSRRPGQRYVPRGVKEGPMKGFVPPPRMQVSNEPLPITRTIEIAEGISVKDLAEKLGTRAKDLIARLLARGVFATINQTLDAELASEISRQFGADTSVITFEEQASKDMTPGVTEDLSALTTITRPPVVTIMGHVDHGKTTLLDSIRHANVADGEAGGITQHIGAYKVTIVDPNSPAYGRQIVFIDTPGHEAFTRMRARGSKVTDIVVLVVAADDGVMPQTLEAIDHAKAANVPIVVAVNKIDKPDAQPDRVKKQLADRGLMPEDWGGTTVFVDVSAKQKKNLNLMMEMICLVADLQEVKANPERSGQGTVLEAKLDRGRGNVATILVQNGTLRVGDYFVVGNTFGRVRAMFDDRGKPLIEAPPSTPAEIIGLEGLPEAGDQFVVVADRDKARGVSEYREQKAREATLAKSSRVSLENLAEEIKKAGLKELNIILKADVQGSVEVLSDLLNKLSTEKVKVRILRSGVGAINEGDVLLGSASNGIVIGFNVRPERKAQELADQEKVDIRLHSIIYELQDEVKKAIHGMLDPVFREVQLGRAEVRNAFRIPKVGTVAGSYVLDGSIKRDAEVRLLRDNVVVFKGKIASLRRFKEDVSEVRNGMECGISIQNYGDIKVGDVIEAFATERVVVEMPA